MRTLQTSWQKVFPLCFTKDIHKVSVSQNERECWDIHSAPISCVISPAYTINSPVVSPISGIHYYYLCYLLRYLRLFLFLFVYKDIQYLSYSHASVHTLLSICHTISYIVWHVLALLFTDFSALLLTIVIYSLSAIQPLSHIFSHWYLTLS